MHAQTWVEQGWRTMYLSMLRLGHGKGGQLPGKRDARVEKHSRVKHAQALGMARMGNSLGRGTPEWRRTLELRMLKLGHGKAG